MYNDLPPSGTRVALIAGPTASGKSALALAIAQRLPATIVNADSAQVYRDLRVLSARPSIEEERQAPHTLFGYIDGAEACSAARWAGDARRAIVESAAAGRLPILVGGTGLYLRTLLQGIAPIPDIDPDIREAVRALPVAEAHAALAAEDPAAAARLAPTDTTRVARALEVVRSTGRTIAAWQAEPSGGIGDRVDLLPLLLLPPRDWLQQRCDLRFETMLETGGIEEAEALAARGLDPALPVMRAIGVPEIIAWRRGEIDRETMLVRAQTSTRQYAKRQYTWFTRQPPADWPRHTTQLNDNFISEIAIILSNGALTP